MDRNRQLALGCLLASLALGACKSEEKEATPARSEATATGEKSAGSAKSAAPAPKPAEAPAAKPEAAAAPPSNQPPWAAEEGVLGCDEVVAHYASLLKMDAKAAEEVRASTLAECEGEWPPAMRRCVAKVESRHGLMSCKASSRKEDCEAGVKGLIEAAASEPNYNERSESLLASCSDISAASSYCLRAAKTISDFKQCADIGPLAEIAASPTLGWSLPAQESWQWPEYFKGDAAERSAEGLIHVDGSLARPTLRIQCEDKALSARIWAKLAIADEGAAKPVSLSVSVDEGPAKKTSAKVSMGEHLIFTDPAGLTAALADGKMLKVAFALKGRGSHELQFRVDGAKDMLTKLDCQAP